MTALLSIWCGKDFVLDAATKGKKTRKVISAEHGGQDVGPSLLTHQSGIASFVHILRNPNVGRSILLKSYAWLGFF